MSTGTSFQPRTCDCSFAPYHHIVKTKAEWNRHLAKQHQDAAENIPANVVLPPPQPQYLKFKAVEEEEPQEYLVATEPEFLEMQLPDKRGSAEDMDEDMEVLRLPKRRHTEPSVEAEPSGEVESGVEAGRWMEEPFLEPDDAPSRPPDDAPPRPPDVVPPRPPDDLPPRPPDEVLLSATAQAPSLNVAPIAFAAGADSSQPRKKRGRPRKQAAAEISASATGRLVDSSQVAEIAAAETARAASSTVGNGLRRSGRNKGFVAAANEACRKVTSQRNHDHQCSKSLTAN